MRDTTLLFLIKKNSEKIVELCLAEKRRGFGAGRWNGVGGKLELGESVEEALKRETFEEIGVQVNEVKKVAELKFIFPDNPSWNQLVHTFVAEKWQGEPSESDEMSPKWFRVESIPFDKMWPDDAFWLPKVLAGEKVKAEFSFGKNDVILSNQVTVVSSF